MAGSHRGTRARRALTGRARTVLGVLVAVVLLGAAVGGYLISHAGTTGTPRQQPSTTPSPSLSATPTLTPTPSPSPSRRPSPTPRPLTRVPANVPRRMTAPGVFDVGFNTSIEPVGGLFTPRSVPEVARWGSRGEPGSPGTDTVYIAGTIRPQGGAFVPLLQLRVGSRIRIRTDDGFLTYTVRNTDSRPAAGLLRGPLFTAKVPGRLVLIGVRYDAAGNRTSTVFLVTAQLSAATRR